MEALPIELLEEIISSLLPPIDVARLVDAPVSSKNERADIFNLRLTSRNIKAGASQAFLKIIGDVPTECREQSLQNLKSLVELADVGNRITCLTFNTCTMWVTGRLRLEEVERIFDKRAEWIKSTFVNGLLAILRSTIRLQHVICLNEETRRPSELDYARRRAGMENIPIQDELDFMKHIMSALVTTSLSSQLETFIILTMFPPKDGYMDGFTSFPKGLPIHLPKLKHLTMSPTYHDISSVALYAPNITSWHTVLDSRAETFDLIPIIDMRTKESSGPDGVSSPLREYTITANRESIDTSTLVKCLNAVTKRIKLIPLLVIRDVIVTFDINYNVRPLSGEGRFEELVFENVQYSLTDDITLSGPSDLKKLDNRWRVLPRLCERANRVRIRTGTVDRIMEKEEWRG